jgi:hypothetical protein
MSLEKTTSSTDRSVSDSTVSKLNPNDAQITMPPSPASSTHHHEPHSSHSEYISSAVLGMADGLTVPFALTAGLSSIGSSKLVVVGGLAEIVAGMISMGLGEYLSTSTKAKQWEVEYAREWREVREKPEDEEEEIYEIFDEYDIPRNDVKPIVERLKRDPQRWVDVSHVHGGGKSDYDSL